VYLEEGTYHICMLIQSHAASARDDVGPEVTLLALLTPADTFFTLNISQHSRSDTCHGETFFIANICQLSYYIVRRSNLLSLARRVNKIRRGLRARAREREREKRDHEVS
jgi:hypothetical protein